MLKRVTSLFALLILIIGCEETAHFSKFHQTEGFCHDFFGVKDS
jgi:hypothetical protein